MNWSPNLDATAKGPNLLSRLLNMPTHAEKKNLRLLIVGDLPDPLAPSMTQRNVAGGILVQDRDNGFVADEDLKVVTKRKPTDAEMADMRMAWKVAKHVKSNAIIYVKDGSTAGIGAGQMSRIDSARIAARKAEDAKEAAGWDTLRTEGCACVPLRRRNARRRRSRCYSDYPAGRIYPRR